MLLSIVVSPHVSFSVFFFLSLAFFVIFFIVKIIYANLIFFDLSRGILDSMLVVTHSCRIKNKLIRLTSRLGATRFSLLVCSVDIRSEMVHSREFGSIAWRKQMSFRSVFFVHVELFLFSMEYTIFIIAFSKGTSCLSWDNMTSSISQSILEVTEQNLMFPKHDALSIKLIISVLFSFIPEGRLRFSVYLLYSSWSRHVLNVICSFKAGVDLHLSCLPNFSGIALLEAWLLPIIWMSLIISITFMGRE